MSQPTPPKTIALPADIDIDTILAAMGQAKGYLDITPGDALELYHLAYTHAQSARVRRPVRLFMSSPVHSAAPGLPAAELAALMARHGVSGVPVVQEGGAEAGSLLGVVSIKDFLPRLGLPKDATPMSLVAGLVGGNLCALGDLAGLTARDLMTAPALSISPDTPVGDAARLMEERSINRLPVVENDRVVGMVTRSDMVRACQVTAFGE